MIDNERAFDVITRVFSDNEQSVTTAFHWHRGRAFSFDRMRNASLSRRDKIGGRVLALYRKNTGAVGAIDWEKFEEWAKQHWRLIFATKILLSMFFLFCI